MSIIITSYSALYIIFTIAKDRKLDAGKTLFHFSLIAGFIIYCMYGLPLLFKEFFPSFSAFTFPAAITALAYTLLAQKIAPQIMPLAWALTLCATLIAGFVLIHFVRFIVRSAE
jgi:tellurite resistance protein TehA-like permease